MSKVQVDLLANNIFIHTQHAYTREVTDICQLSFCEDFEKHLFKAIFISRGVEQVSDLLICLHLLVNDCISKTQNCLISAVSSHLDVLKQEVCTDIHCHSNILGR